FVIFVSGILTIAGCQRVESPDSASQANGNPDERPNILLIVADDLGYLDVGFFGSEIATPHLDELAMGGLRLANLHAAPSCAPTRAMLMSGTTFGEAGVTALDDPLLEEVATLPERLQAAGYHTYMAGKWNLGYHAEDGPAERGFDRSYALMKAADNHLGRSTFSTSTADLPTTRDGFAAYREDGEPAQWADGWFSSRVYTDKLVEYIDENIGDGVPWFGYLAFTAPHWPLQIPDDWLDSSAGRYDEGYNVLLEARYREAQRLGVLPDSLDLEGYMGSVPAWEELDDEERRILTRTMEVYAAMVENMDMHVGRVVDFLETAGQLDNTVILFSSDNGADGAHRTFQPTTVPRTDTDSSFENIGRAESFFTVGRGWGEAAMAPYRGVKGALFEGGTLVAGFINHAEIADKGGIDHNYLTMMDVLPTFLEIAEQPVSGVEFQGREVLPIRGRSFWGVATGERNAVREADEAVPWAVPTPDGPPRRTVLVRWPWKLYGERTDDAELHWSLYNLETDPGERQDLALERPEMISELVSVWQSYGR
ncbi:MAG: sulfatase-like hydrolase/transferase, partial [Gammaproteobacteria bacterium]